MALIGVLLVLAAGGTEVALALRYERDQWPQQWWRAVTGHFVHLGTGHALLNAAGAVLVGLLFGRALNGLQWLVVLVLSLAAIDLGFGFRDPSLEWYVGLSGVLHGLFVAGALCEGRRDGYLLLVALAAKLVYEQLVGPLPGSAEAAGGPVVVNAHLYGAAGGLLAFGVLRGSVFFRRVFD